MSPSPRTMAQDHQEEGTKEGRLKTALWYHVGKMIDAVGVDQGSNATPQFIGGLTELLWTQIETISRDTESFARHAGRDTVRAEDVLLVARRNQGLHNILEDTASAINKKNSSI